MVSPGSGDSVEYRFGDVVVQPASHRVLKDGVEVALEPKALAVLVELLRQPQVVVERDQLLDKVWGHRFVTPGVLNRVIALLRKALGDDADHPRYIRTVHGVGYSFIGEPAEPHQSSPPVAVPQPAAARPPRGHKTWPVVLTVALTALLGGWWLVTHQGAPSDDRPASGPISGVRLALLPISAVDPTDDVLARGLTDVLGEALARIPEIELVEQESSRLAVARTNDPREIARLLGTDRLLRIRLGREGEDAVLSAELLDGGDGKPVWSRQLVQRRNALTGVIGPMLSSLRTVLLPDAPPTRLDPIVRADAVAQALYLETRATLVDDAESRARNLALLEQAVQQDPAFALGWAALANARRERFATGEANLDEAMTGAQEAVDRALEIDPDLVEALLVQCAIKTNQWRSSEALGPSRRAIELAPNDARTVGTRANVLGYLARPRESLELRRRAIELNPLSPFPVWTMSTDYLMLGDRERALEQLSKALAMRGTGSYVGAFGARLELAFGNPANAILRYRGNPDQATRYALYIPLAAVQALVAIGELGDAEALFDSLHPRLPYTPNYLETKLSLLWAEGRYAAAVAWLDGPGRDAAQDPYRTVARAHARALAGNAEGALADYASGLEGPAERDLVFNMWWPTRLGPAELGNWVALRKAAGSDYAAELKDLEARLQQAADAGTRVPVLGYYRAMVAALQDDPKAADAALTEARNNGWFDPLALEVDLAWRPYQRTGWFQSQRQWLADKAKRERALLVAG